MYRLVFFLSIFTIGCSNKQTADEQAAKLESAYHEILISAEKASEQAMETCRVKEDSLYALQPTPNVVAEVKALGKLHTALQTELRAAQDSARYRPDNSTSFTVSPTTIASIQSAYVAFEAAVKTHFPDEQALPGTPTEWLNQTRQEVEALEFVNEPNRFALQLAYNNLSTQTWLLYSVFLDQVLDKQYAFMATELERREGGFGIAPVLHPITVSPKAGGVFQAQILASPYLYNLGGNVHVKVNGATIPHRYGLGWYEAPASPGQHTLKVEMSRRNPKTGEITSVQTQYQYSVE
jgi:hypothetical protein